MKKFKYLIILLIIVMVVSIYGFTYSRFQTEAVSSTPIEFALYILDVNSISESISVGDISPRDEAYSYYFTVSNNDGVNRTDVNMQYDLYIETTTNLPLEYELYVNSGTDNIIVSDTTTADAYGTYFRTLTTDTRYFSYSADEVDTYELKVYFPSTYIDYNYQDIAELITISVDSKQVIS